MGTSSLAHVLEAWLPADYCEGLSITQIVGTNGKGSTATMLARGLLHHGSGPVGLYTSPHLHRIEERIRVDGSAISSAALDDCFGDLARVEAALGLQLTFFEALTAVAARYFLTRGCTFWVLEAGLGGAADATWAIPANLTLLTRIALDHQRFLGPDLEAIANTKASALRAGVPVISASQVAEVSAVLRAAAQTRDTELVFAAPTDSTSAATWGAHQQQNAGLALAALRKLAPRAAAQVSSLGAEPVAGRLEGLRWQGVQLWLDVAHNLDAIDAICAALLEAGERPAAVVFGCLADKQAGRISARLRTLAPIWWVDLGRGGALPSPTEDIRSFDAPDDPELWRAIAGARDGPVLVCGSHILVAGVRAQVLDLEGSDPLDPMPRC